MATSGYSGVLLASRLLLVVVAHPSSVLDSSRQLIVVSNNIMILLDYLYLFVAEYFCFEQTEKVILPNLPKRNQPTGF